jgi:hypothetical protein
MDEARLRALAHVLRRCETVAKELHSQPAPRGGYGLAMHEQRVADLYSRRRQALEALLSAILDDDDEQKIDAEARIYEQEEIAQARRDDAFPGQKKAP